MRNAAYLSKSRHGIYYLRLPVLEAFHPIKGIAVKKRKTNVVKQRGYVSWRHLLYTCVSPFQSLMID